MLLSRAINLLLGSANLSKRQNGPQALVIPPTGQFLGNDGQFSTFLIDVGNPPQSFRILPAPNRYEFSLPLTASCDALAFQNCGPLRGAVQNNSTGFNTSASSTWEQAGLFKFQNTGKNYEDEAQWGFDDVAFANLDRKVPAVKQLIAGFYNEKSRFVGLVGLDPRGTSLGPNIPRGLGPLQILKDNGTIPSLTFGYTAGAKYRNNINGSLTLGGFDASLLSLSKVVIPINRELGTYPLGVLSIKADNVLNDHSGNLSTTKITLPIDATVTELWLPREICDEFEKAFNLTWNDTVSRYLVDNDTHRKLKEANPEITFSIAGDSGSGETNSTEIRFPYGAFDHFLDMNIARSPTNYFPIRRAADETQYALGRVFLQEAYLLADFEQRQFTIAQTTRSTPPLLPNIVTVAPSTNGNSEENGEGGNGGGNEEGDGGSGSSGLSGGAIAGIVIGVLALIAILLGIFFWRRKKNSKEPKKGAVELPVEEKPASWRSSLPAFQKNRASRNSGPSGQTAQPAHEVEGSRVTSPAPVSGNEEYFAPKDRSAAAELEGSPGPRYELH